MNVDETAIVYAGFVFGQPLNLTTTAWTISGDSNAHGTIAFDAKDSIRLKGVDHITTYEGAPGPQLHTQFAGWTELVNECQAGQVRRLAVTDWP